MMIEENDTLVELQAEQDESEEMIDEEFAFYEENDTVVEPGAEQADHVIVGHFANDRKAALAHDRVAVLFFGDEAETYFPPKESEHVILADDVMRQINELKAGRLPH